MTIFAVTGRHRTGTSIMMHALATASTMKVIVDPSFDDGLRAVAPDAKTYDPNPTGYYLPPINVRVGDVPDGSLIKVSLRNADWYWAPLGDYNVVRMVRDETERAASWNRSFKFVEDPDFQDYYTFSEQVVAERPDVRVTVVDFRALVVDPVHEFIRLRDAGWEFDVQAAAACIDPALYRNRAS